MHTYINITSNFLCLLFSLSLVFSLLFIYLFCSCFLLIGAELKIVEDFQVHFPNRHVSESLIQVSGKLVLVDKLLPKLREKGHKVRWKIHQYQI